MKRNYIKTNRTCLALSFLSCKKINSDFLPDFLPRPNILWDTACVFCKILPRGYFASFILLLWRLVSQNNRKCYIGRLHLVIPYMHEHFLVHYFSDTFEGGESRTNIPLIVKETLEPEYILRKKIVSSSVQVIPKLLC